MTVLRTAASSGTAGTSTPSEPACRGLAIMEAAPLKRRMAAFVYEGVLMFGVAMGVGLVYSVTTNQRHAMHGREGMMASLFCAMGLYFTWFWTHGGQTLAMKTWHLRLISADGAAVGWRQALARYACTYLWFMPAWGGAWLAGVHRSGALYGAMGAWIALYMLLTRVLPQQQFLHDVLCRTRIIDTRG